jgi:hypothetical protein
VTQDASSANLKGSLRGQVISPTDQEYDEVRRVWNGMFDRHPRAIARCAGAADVIAAVAMLAKTISSWRSVVVVIAFPATRFATAA